MSREINIGYRDSKKDSDVSIELQAPYFLFGTQQTSKSFWSLSIWSEIGVTRLAELGQTDPVYFIGWNMMHELEREIRLFQDNISSIDFNPDIKSSFLAHLVYCHCLLISTAPQESVPELTIG